MSEDNTHQNNEAGHQAEHDDTHAEHSHIVWYSAIWILLLLALILSLIIGEFGTSNCVIAVIFVVAIIKSAMVIAYYMKLTDEPWFIKLAMFSALMVLFVFFYGLYPDITMNNAGLPRSTTIEAPLHDPDLENGKVVFSTTCITCHQADGSGKIGDAVLAANLVADSSRLLQDEAILIDHVYNGYNSGTLPVIMPPQKTQHNKQNILDAISYMRQQFGNPGDKKIEADADGKADGKAPKTDAKVPKAGAH
ncbi:MAG: c-type cytochrome [Planctomycetes bacterium]|nr:c-type cytochrome [Planctomycetota bacterium]